MDPELLAFLKENFDSINQRFRSMDQRFDAMDRRFDALDQRVEKIDERVGHNQVIMEALQSKIELVAEGVTGANERIDALRKEAKEDNAELRTLLTLSVTDLSKRVRALEERRSSRPTSRKA